MKTDRIDIPKIPKVFISYNHKDREVAHKIKDRLELAGIEVTNDSVGMSTGENIEEFIKKCIEQSVITLSVVSSNSLKSAWVAMESIWSYYDVDIRGRYFIPCYIDTSFLDYSFVSTTHKVIEEEINKIDKEIIFRRKKKIGIQDIQGELDRLSRLGMELPSIIGRLKKTRCGNLCPENFDSGMENVIKDILNKKPVATETVQVEIPRKTKPTTKSQKPLKEVKKISGQKDLQTQLPILVEPPSSETLRCLQDPEESINATPTPNPAQITIAGIEMVFVKGGEFIMGDENSGEKDEKPVHKVFVSDFYIGKYPVTQKQWIELMGSDPSNFKGDDNCPVEQVSWNKAQEFLQKLNTKTKKTFRLPTEAEWEYAAGGGASAVRTKWAGTSKESELGDYVRHYDNSEGKIHPVGSKNPNNLGIYDMSGNVWEWCNDWYSDTYYTECESIGITNNPKGPESGPGHVVRGGSWSRSTRSSRVAYRDFDKSVAWEGDGFRLLLEM